MSIRISSFIVVVATLLGSQAPALSATNAPTAAIVSGTLTLTLLAQCIAVSDRIVATNWATGYPGFSISISGDQVKQIVKAVSTATRYANQEHPDSEWDWQLHFYAGTNFLSAICIARDTFLADGVYRDDAGVLGRVYHDSVNREYVARVYKDEDKEFAATTKAEARRWLKSTLHSIHGQSKKKVVQYVDWFYDAGAVNVFMADIKKVASRKNDLTENAEYMLVVLPQDLEARRKVFLIHSKAVLDWGIDADGDVGQKYLWYRVDWSESE
jgi:hypothetical protein